MQISGRFTMAIHILACIDYFDGKAKITSDFLAGSVSANPVVVRRLLGQLKEAGLVRVTRGAGGASLVKPLEEISFFDVYRAVECVENQQLFHFHENPCPDCPVGRHIHQGLDTRLERIQHAMEEEMKTMTVGDVKDDILLELEAESNVLTS